MEKIRASFCSFCCFLRFFDFFGFLNFYDFFQFLCFMIFLDFSNLRCKIKQGNICKARVASMSPFNGGGFWTHKHVKHTNSPIICLLGYIGLANGVLNICKVREAQICRWKKILPHSWGEMVTQISSTSQRYKVLWGLAKSDKILLPREVSFDSPPNIYTLLEH